MTNIEMKLKSREQLSMEIITLQQKLMLKDKEIERLNKQIEEYQKSLDETTSEKIDLENIIKEAIEYIEQNKQISMFADLRKEGTRQYDLECDADDLLNILKGEDK